MNKLFISLYWFKIPPTMAYYQQTLHAQEMTIITKFLGLLDYIELLYTK